jgi:phospholipase/carboxylesterase
VHHTNVITAGRKIDEAEKALVMFHGRGANAEDIIGVAPYLPVNDFAQLAPQATNNTWYPYSFLAPPRQNEPWLSTALDRINEIVRAINIAGIRDDHIYFLGFSQGACLTLEFVARNARRWGGIAAFTGGLIGDRIYEENYHGDFGGTPVFLSTGDPDPHVPADRVHASASILSKMNGSVTEKVYPNRGHTVSPDELDCANELIFSR